LREVLNEIDRWHAEGKRVALATVVRVWGSAPRRPGAKMAVSSQSEIAGSVSGGCVESAVVTEALETLESGRPRLVRYGVTDEAAWAVGLTCGGTIEIFIEPLARDAILVGLRDAIEHERLLGLVTVIDVPGVGSRLLVGPDGRTTGDPGTPELADGAARLATEHFAHFSAGRGTQQTGRGAVELFFETQAPRSKLIVVGAVHVAVPLVRFAAALGFHTTVVDPRSAFASAERFAHADALIVDWPQDALPRVGLNEASCVAVLTHDIKVDVPALVCALRSPARYVGVLGSRKTHAARVRVLREAGLSDEQIGRIRAPIGLALGGRRPAEIAVAIIAEIVAAAYGKDVGDPV